MRIDTDDGRLLAGRRCVVTGGSLGIGAAITRGLLARGAEVLVACRDVARAEARRRELAPDGAEARLVIERLDVSSLAEVHAFTGRLAARWPRLDVLVHNAGASFPRRRLSVDGHELTFATNVLGGFALTRALRPLLRRADGHGRVVHVGSAAQYLCSLRSERLLDVRGPYLHERVYAHTKRAQFELSERWAEVLDEEGITSTCAHPGPVAPGLAEAFPRYFRVIGPRLPDADAGADTVVWLASSPAAAGRTGGLWWRRDRQPADLLPSTRSSAAERERLWRLCERLTDAVTSRAMTPDAAAEEPALRHLAARVLARAPLLAGVKPALFERLAAAGTLHRVAAGAPVPDGALMVVLVGAVRLDTPRGQHPLGPGDCCGEAAVLDEHAVPTRAVAVRETLVLAIVGDALADLLAQRPDLRWRARALVEQRACAPTPRTIVIEGCSRVPVVALARLVTCALTEARPGPVSVVTDPAVAVPPGATRLRFLDGGAARPARRSQRVGPTFDVWLGSPGRHRDVGDIVLPPADELAPAMAIDAPPLPPGVRAALARLARALDGRRVGVALSGGGAWGFAHLALLRALEAAGVPVDILAGSSIGTVVGSMYARHGATGLETLLATNRRVHVTAAASLVSTATIERAALELLGDADIADLGTSGPQMIAMAVDLTAGVELPLRHGPLATAVRASCSFPGIYGPTLRDGRRLIDGAVTNNAPISVLRAEGADLLIAADAFVTPAPLAAEPPRGALARILATLSPTARVADAARAAMILGSRITAHLADEADVVFAPDLEPFRLTDWHCAHAIVDRAAAPARTAALMAAARLAAL